MINFNYLMANKKDLRMEYLTAQPFPLLVIDNFCDQGKLLEMRNQVPELENKSRDYMFANNKFEKSNYKELGPLFQELYDDLASELMNEFLSYICCQAIFVDPKNHGGGLHQGKKNSFLDMHLDFNYHPLHKNWYRALNMLLYLNRDWKKQYGGHLKVNDLRTGEEKEIEVPFNRMVIQQCGSHTLHGYDMTSFPEGNFRTSIATYAYTVHQAQIGPYRTTDWFPSKDASASKKLLARHWNTIVQAKNKLLGSGTAKNQ